MSTVTYDIATILQDNDFGVIGDNIFVEQDLPPTPDNMILVNRAGSWRPDFPSIDLRSPVVELRIRAGKGQGQLCEDLAERIEYFFNSIANYSVNDSTFVYINHASGLESAGIDSLMRPEYLTTFACLKTNHNP